MTDDCDAKVFFLDAVTVEALRRVQLPRRHTRVALDGVASAERPPPIWI
jgi:hypothetical protein